MSLLGKILALLNVLGAVGFVCLAAMDYGKQQSWKYANFRQDLTNNGLPLDEEEKDRFGGFTVDKMSDETLREMFPSGQPVRIQIDEVKRIKNLLQRPLDDAQNDP